MTTTIPARVPTSIDASLRAAAVAGRPRGTLAKMIAVRTVVATTNPPPIRISGTMNARYGRGGPDQRSHEEVAQADGQHPAGDEDPGPEPREQVAGDRSGDDQGGEQRRQGEDPEDRAVPHPDAEVERQLRHRHDLRDGDDQAHEQRDGHRAAFDAHGLCVLDPAAALPEDEGSAQGDAAQRSARSAAGCRGRSRATGPRRRRAPPRPPTTRSRTRTAARRRSACGSSGMRPRTTTSASAQAAIEPTNAGA